MKRTILLDGDIVAYKLAASAENATDWGDGVFTMYADAEEAKGRLDAQISELMSTLDAQRVMVALSCSRAECWRRDVLPTYKANRKDNRSPMILTALKQHLRDKWEVWERPRLEADDVIGIIATSPALHKGAEVVCASIDKDFKTIPGKHVTLNKLSEGVRNVTVEQADYWHLYQTLVGDATDGYAGCPGTGPKKAEAALKNAVNGRDGDLAWAYWHLGVVAQYKKAGLDESEALRMARVARILRNSDYDFKQKKVILWNPPAA